MKDNTNTRFVTFCLLVFSLNLIGSKAFSFELPDSLQKIIALKKDTAQVNLLNRLAKQTYRSDIDLADVLANKAYRVSKEITFPDGMAESYISLAYKPLVKGEYQRCHHLLDSSIAIAERSGNTSLIATGLNFRGILYYNGGELEKALESFERSLEHKKLLNDQVDLAKTQNNIASIYLKIGYLDKALENFLGVLKVDELRADSAAIASDYNNIGLVYYDKKDHTQARKYFDRCLQVSTIDKILKGNCLNNIGLVEAAMNNPEAAINFHSEALKLFNDLGYKRGIANCYNNIGTAYESLGNIDQAIRNYVSSMEIKKEEMSVDLASTLGNIGSVYWKKGDHSSALKYILESNRLAEQNKQFVVLRNNYEKLALIYSRLNDQGKVQEAYRLYHAYSDTVMNQETAARIAEMQVKYETEKKEQSLQLKSVEIETQKNRNSLQLSLFISIIVFVIVLGFLVYNRNRIRQKALLAEEINIRQKLQFKAVLDAQEEERRRIAKELHDGVGNQLLALQMTWNSVEPKLKEIQTEDATSGSIRRILKDVTEEVRSVSHRMMPKVLDEFGFVPAISDMLERSLAHSGIRYSFETHNLGQRLDSRLEVAVYRITQELTNNVIKHSAATEVTVQMLKNKSSLVLMVEDNGKGIDNLNTGNPGIGISGIRSRLDVINGELNIQPGEKSGTLVTVRIPLEYES